MKPGLQFGKANRKMMRTHGCRRALGVSGGDGDGGPFTNKLWDDSTTWDDSGTFTD